MAEKKNIMRLLIIVLSLSIFTCLLPLSGQAVTAPDVQELAGITMNKSALWSPGKLSLDADGSLYVVDSFRNRVLKFGRNGEYIKSIAFRGVSAIATAPNGALYIGSHEDYSVSIYTGGRVVGHLGGGKNEFRSIRDIAVDPSNGRVYVVDNVGNAVRIFDASGADLGSMAGLNLPMSIDVNDKGIYIIDSPVVEAAGGSSTESRISIFDRSYNLLTVIDENPVKQVLYRPTDIKVSGGIIYISDAALGSVQVLDMAGTFLGEIKSQDGRMNVAVSLAVSSDGIMYVSSSETHSVHMFALTEKSGVGGNPAGLGY
ncbi:MAG: NHL repeat-containing protein [Nitrospirae bacterium]|nr:NHL repeat-containing protein [Nitrospirota bacterium]